MSKGGKTRNVLFLITQHFKSRIQLYEARAIYLKIIERVLHDDLDTDLRFIPNVKLKPRLSAQVSGLDLEILQAILGASKKHQFMRSIPLQRISITASLLFQ